VSARRGCQKGPALLATKPVEWLMNALGASGGRQEPIGKHCHIPNAQSPRSGRTRSGAEEGVSLHGGIDG
jgi:hypothetical protein